MSDFEIHIEPDMPPARSPQDLDIPVKFYTEIKNALPNDFDLYFEVGGKQYGYHPRDILVIWDDLVTELDRIDAGTSHYINLAGYTVLGVEMSNGAVTLFNPPDEHRIGRAALVAPIEVATFRRHFEEAAAAVYGFIQSALDGARR